MYYSAKENVNVTIILNTNTNLFREIISLISFFSSDFLPIKFSISPSIYFMRIFYHRPEHFSFLVERGTLFSRIESQNLRLDQEGRVASRLEFHGAGCANKSNIFLLSFSFAMPVDEIYVHEGEGRGRMGQEKHHR